MNKNFNIDEFIRKAHDETFRSINFDLKFPNNKTLYVRLSQSKSRTFQKLYSYALADEMDAAEKAGLMQKPYSKERFNDTLKAIKDPELKESMEKNPPKSLGHQTAQMFAIERAIIGECIENLFLVETGEKICNNDLSKEFMRNLITQNQEMSIVLINHWSSLNNKRKEEEKEEDIAEKAKK